jgi:nucleoside-diphosphate-sugar epimerase
MTANLVLLTGGTGFLGAAILVDLLKSGFRVRVAARSQEKIDRVLAAPSISVLNKTSSELEFVIVPDMTVVGAYDDAVRGVDFIIHAAAPLPGATNGASSGTQSQYEEQFVQASVQGNLGILKAAHEKGENIRRVVMTSSTVAIAPPDLLTTNTAAREVARGPDTRVSVPPPPYGSPLETYCISKAAALNASEDFMRTHSTSFDLISIIPSWIFGKDELARSTGDLRTGSSSALLNTLLQGQQRDPSIGSIGNAVLCSQVARGHVRALGPDIAGNQSFLFNVEAIWEDTVPIARRHFPEAFTSGLFLDSNPRQTVPIKWDSSKVGFPRKSHGQFRNQLTHKWTDFRSPRD